MSRIALSKIPALTFYKDSVTLSRRTSPIPQLVCVGRACDLYTPEVVRCENTGGGEAGDVDWKVRSSRWFTFTQLTFLHSVRLIFQSLYVSEE